MIDPPATDARTDVLRRIRAALGERSPDRAGDYAAIPREYQRSGHLDRPAKLSLLTSRLEDYGVTVHHAGPANLQQTIATALDARGKRRLVIPIALPVEWEPAGVEFVRDMGLSAADLDRADGAITGCTVAIASTGTIVLCHSPAEGRRVMTLVPDYHLCVVLADQVVETVPEAFRWIEVRRCRLVTAISGPSATADIEMTRVQGVHGPRTLDVVLVD
jgi:L-lactate dehydrogenase complex protein LldG